METETLEGAPVEVAETTQNDRTELEARVADNLAEVFPTGVDEVLDNVAEDTKPEKPVPPHKRPPEAPAEELAEASETTAEAKETPSEKETKPAVEEAAPTDGPTLPAAYRRTLKAYEWTDEEINQALTQPGFLGTAAKLHATRTKEMQHFAEVGRKARQTAPAPVQETDLSPVDIEGLKKVYGDEALIKQISDPVNAAIARINQALPKIRASEQAAQIAQLETLGKQVDQFFGSSEAADIYGKAAGSATDAQIVARTAVLEMADALRSGARQQGRDMSFDEALQTAYDAKTSVTKTETARKDIVKTLQTRAKAITIKPSGRAATPKVADRSKLEMNVKDGLAKIFGR